MHLANHIHSEVRDVVFHGCCSVAISQWFQVCQKLIHTHVEGWYHAPQCTAAQAVNGIFYVLYQNNVYLLLKAGS